MGIFSSLMDQSLSVERATLGTDASGGSTRAWAPALAGIAAAVQPVSAHERDVWDRRNMRVDVAILCEADFDALLAGGLKLGDRFKDAAGIYYAVQGVERQYNRIISPSPLYRVLCERTVV